MDRCPHCNKPLNLTFEKELKDLMFYDWSWTADTFEEDVKTIVDLHNKYKEKENG